MNCISPVRITKNLSPSDYPDGLLVPCGSCISCRIAKRREWSLRLLHELSYHDDAVFLTLTYDDAHVPPNMSLRKRDLQLFFKRIRKALGVRRIKYFACGEYGDETFRPHYHCIIYGLSLAEADKDIVTNNWQHCDWTVPVIHNRSFGLVEPDSIRYVAQYIDKKFSGDLAEQEYKNKGREPVFRLLSKGLGKQYAIDTQEQIKDNMYITLNGVRMSIPRYYCKLLDLDTRELTDQAMYKDSEVNEHYTGLNVDSNTYYRTQETSEIINLNEAKKSARRQYESTLTSKSRLRSRKI